MKERTLVRSSNPPTSSRWYLSSIQSCLINNFRNIQIWFNESREVLNFKPNDGGWSIIEILEHISLTNHYLLIIIEKSTKKAKRKAANGMNLEIISKRSFSLNDLYIIGVNDSFKWERPDHMVPNGELTDGEIIAKLNTQEINCLNLLNSMKHGEGILQLTTMTVNDLGKLNVYEYIYFLAMHIERHIEQMNRVKDEYLNVKKL